MEIKRERTWVPGPRYPGCGWGRRPIKGLEACARQKGIWSCDSGCKCRAALRHEEPCSSPTSVHPASCPQNSPTSTSTSTRLQSLQSECQGDGEWRLKGQRREGMRLGEKGGREQKSWALAYPWPWPCDSGILFCVAVHETCFGGDSWSQLVISFSLSSFFFF